MKKYTVVGDSKKITLPFNETKLKVVGSKCIVKVTRNDGEIEVIGNECRIDIEDNYGAIQVVGYNCVVNVKRLLNRERVHLVGQRNQLIVNGKKTANLEPQLSPFSRNLDDMLDSIFKFSFEVR